MIELQSKDVVSKETSGEQDFEEVSERSNNKISCIVNLVATLTINKVELELFCFSK